MHYGPINNISLLLVENKPEDSKTIFDYLQKSDLDFKKTFHAKSLADAIKYLSDQSIDIIILNINLPDSFGAETFYSIYSKYQQIFKSQKC